MDRFTVLPGDRIIVEIPGTGEAEGAQPEESAADNSNPSGLLYSGYPPADLLIPRKFIVEFLDLATRLRSVPENPGGDLTRSRAMDAKEIPEAGDAKFNEYVEINADGLASNFAYLGETSASNGSAGGLQAQIEEAIYTALTRALLGSRAPHAEDSLDPLGKTPANASKRLLSHCMPLPFNLYSKTQSGGIIVDCILRKRMAGDTSAPLILPLAEVSRESVRDIGKGTPKLDVKRWKKRKAGAKDALEKWNSVNITGGEAKESGYLDVRGLTGAYDLEIDSRLYYERFNTGDSDRFKITTRPEYDAPEVSFSFKPRAARIFLVPQWTVLLPMRRFSLFSTLTWETAYYDYDLRTGRQNVGISLSITAQTPDFIISGLNSSSFFDPRLKMGTYAAVGQSSGKDVIVTVSGALSGAATFPGVLVIGGTFSRVQGSIAVVPGLLIQVSALFKVAEGTSGGMSFETRFLPEQAGLSFTGNITTGTVGRLPVYGRLTNAGWDNLPDSGAALFGNANSAVFTRRPLWNTQELIKDLSDSFQITPLSFSAHDEAGGLRCTFHPSRIRAPALALRPFGGSGGDITAAAASAWENLRGCIGSFAWHRNARRVGGNPGTYSGFERVDFIPSRQAPAGRLVGIIQQGAVYYVWAKTAQDSFLPDSARDTATGRL